MKKYIVLSVNENSEYLFSLPLTVWTWQKIGWNTIVMFWNRHNDENNVSNLVIKEIEKSFQTVITVGNSAEYSSTLVSQVARLYAAHDLKDGDCLMLGDSDMLALSDYWKFQQDVITAWGKDLTDYHYPMCYVCAPKRIWSDLMGLSDNGFLHYYFDRDFKNREDANSPDPQKRWVTDQNILTEKLLSTKHKITHIDRGLLPNGYPVGRVDRSAWSLDHPQLIDCHLPRGMWRLGDTGVANFAKVMRLLYTVWPDEDFNWFKNYVTEFRKIVP